MFHEQQTFPPPPSGEDLEGNKTTRNLPLVSMSLMTLMTPVSDMKWQLLQIVCAAEKRVQCLSSPYSESLSSTQVKFFIIL